MPTPGKLILVVEDERDQLELLVAEVLEEEGYRVSHGGRGPCIP